MIDSMAGRVIASSLKSAAERPTAGSPPNPGDGTCHADRVLPTERTSRLLAENEALVHKLAKTSRVISGLVADLATSRRDCRSARREVDSLRAENDSLHAELISSPAELYDRVRD